MSLIEINHNPSKKDLRWFAILFAIFFGAIGTMSFSRGEHFPAYTIWAAAGSVAPVGAGTGRWREDRAATSSGKGFARGRAG